LNFFLIPYIIVDCSTYFKILLIAIRCDFLGLDWNLAQTPT
jgi:hypothetical protein